MGSDDDPFGLADSERTQIARPLPGGRPAGASRPAPEARPASPLRAAGSIAAVSGTPGRGPLVECAFGLLSLAPLLRARTPPAPPEHLRSQLEAELQSFADRAQARGVDTRLVALGHYALCAFLDDVILNTPWGAHGIWRANSLAGALHHDAAAGEHFFAYLDQAKRQPERSRPALELMAACLALGFEGAYRLEPQGQATLRQLRAEVLDTLRRLDGVEEQELSPHWRGVEAAHVPITRRIPLWVYATGVLGVLVLVYAGLAMRLGSETAQLDAVVAALPPAGPVGIVRQAPVTAQPVAVQVPRAAALAPRIRECLPAAAQRDAEAVVENLQGVRVRLPNAGLFASGSAQLQSAVAPLVACIAEVLKEAEGRIAIVGHTDNVPIRTARFPSNWELSRARAEAVAAVARPVLGQRIQVTGRADADPAASNATEDGRARNRRVEILLLR
ncbi:type VI secretion system protein TssL, long form [Falsiroseomonas sp.]|uniref:type VI secretion system protein TssL, long form n=1 Tax=Falsiroseomonas sp. TaxID=2870721 RepID=UPI003567ED2D